MTEPVAYLITSPNGEQQVTIEKPDFGYIEYLYTAEQLHQRVKMTQAEFDEFKLLYNLFNGSTVRGIINTVENNESKRFTNLKSRLNKTGKDLEIIILWSIYNPEEPEETIEIVHDMKWFVRSKEKYQPDMDQGISESGYLYLTQGDIYSVEYHEMTAFKDEATQFNTEDEAKLWTTPDTEAVQLPVEGE